MVDSSFGSGTVGSSGATGAGIPVDKIDPRVLSDVQNSDIFKGFLARSQAAQQRARQKFQERTGRTGSEIVGPGPATLVPGAGVGSGADSASSRGPSIPAVLPQAMQGAQSLADMGIGSVRMTRNGAIEFGATQACPPRAGKPARERSANKKFRFRERRPRPQASSADGDVGQPPAAPPQDLGGFKSTGSLAPGLPVRLLLGPGEDAEAEAGIRAWCRHEGLAEEHDAGALALRGQVLRVLELSGASRVKVVAVGDSSSPPVSLPAQVLGACPPSEILQNIAWRMGADLPEPSDFSESVAVADAGGDPGAAPDAHSEAISMAPASAGASPFQQKVRRMRTTPAVGWQGMHGRVVRQVLRPGRATQLPPDGSRLSVRLHEAVEACGGRTRRIIAGELPRTCEFALGDGEACDALECVLPRMAPGEVVAAACEDAGSLVQPGGAFGLEPLLLGPGGAEGGEAGAGGVAAGGGEGCAGGGHRAFFVLELLGAEGSDPLTWEGQDERRLEYAASRKDVGTQAFKSGRVRLARERYRRTANFLCCGLMVPAGGPGSYRVENQGAARQLRNACWLNAAQCELHLKNHAPAKRYCDAVLHTDPDNVKARFRRATALVALGDLGLLAIEDLNKVLVKDPSNAQAKQLLRQARHMQKQRDQSNAGLFRRACADLVDDFEAIKASLEAARAADDGAAAEAALRNLEAALPRLTVSKATALQLGRCLEGIEGAPPGGNPAAREAAAALLAQTAHRGLLAAPRARGPAAAEPLHDGPLTT